MAELHSLEIKVHRGARGSTVVQAIGEMDMASVDALRTVLLSWSSTAALWCSTLRT